MSRSRIDRCLQRTRFCGAAGIWLLQAAMVGLLGGCAVDEVRLISYNSDAEVKPLESQAPAVVGSSPFPWDVVLGGASDILTGARKKAIEEKVGYRESRSFVLFRMKRAESSQTPCSNPPAEQGDRASGKVGK